MSCADGSHRRLPSATGAVICAPPRACAAACAGPPCGGRLPLPPRFAPPYRLTSRAAWASASSPVGLHGITFDWERVPLGRMWATCGRKERYMETSFKALVVEEHDGAASSSLRDATHDELPAGDVLVAVAYSGLNYKDGLAALGKNKVIRSFPMVPGIDLPGTVVPSHSPPFHPAPPTSSP